MRLAVVIWVAFLSCMAEAQVVSPIIVGTTITSSSGSPVAASGLFSGDVDMIWTVGTITGGGSIVFTMCSTDPLNPINCITSVSSQSISSPGTAAAKLHAGHSSTVLVSWAVTGTFSARVQLSVQGVAPSEIQGIDGGVPVAVIGSLSVSPSSGTFSSWQCTNVTCSSTGPTGLPGDAGMTGVIVSSPGLSSPTVNIGPANAVDAGSGTPVFAGVSYPFSNNATASMYCETQSGNATVQACVVWP